MASKVIIHSVPRSGSMLIHDLYIRNNYTPFYQDDVDLDCKDDLCVHTHLSRPWFTSKYLEDLTIIIVDRRNIVEQICSYIMSSTLQQWHIYPELKSSNPDLNDIKSFNYTNDVKTGGGVTRHQVFYATHRMIEMKRNQRSLIDLLPSYRRMFYEDFIDDGLETTCSNLNIDPTNCRWDEHKNPRKFEDVFVNYKDAIKWINEILDRGI